MSACTYERNFPQAKLDSEINLPFLLNEHGYLYVILFYLRKINKISSDGKKDIGYDLENNHYTNALRPLRFKWCDFPTNFIILVPYARHFLPVSFFPSITLINYASSYRKI